MMTVPAKTILSGYMEHGWFGANYNMNIYRGCNHGCIYCDSRSECYRIEDFNTVCKKDRALELLERDLKSKRRTGLVITGAMSDPYNPLEEKEQLTRGALSLLDRHQYGVVLMTKSDLVTRDMDLLQSIRTHSPAVVNITITTASDELCRKVEPNVSVTSKRLEAIQKLSKAGIICGVLLMPILPFINDTVVNIQRIVSLSAEAGAKWVYAESNFAVSLRDRQRAYFYDKLDQLAAVRINGQSEETSCQSEKPSGRPLDVDFFGMKEKYIKTFGNRYWCGSPEHKRLYARFQEACLKHGLIYDHGEIDRRIRQEFVYQQISLF